MVLYRYLAGRLGLNSVWDDSSLFILYAYVDRVLLQSLIRSPEAREPGGEGRRVNVDKVGRKDKLT